MSDILINGMDMPRGNNALVVDSAGTITKVNRRTGKVEATDPFSVKAIELPPHGELIDRQAVKVLAKKIKDEDGGFFIDAMSWGEALSTALDKAPTIVEANDGHTD